MPAELINTTNITGNMAQTITGINDASGQILFASILFTIYLVLFMATKGHGTKVALLGVSFILAVLSTMAWFIGWISGWVTIIFIVLLIISIVMIRLFD